MHALCRGISLFVVVTSYVSLFASNYFVAQRNPRASDDGPGDAERPWKSISKAAEVMTAGDTVTIDSGIYRERVTVTASGKAESPIRFAAAPGAHVVVTGADQISSWLKCDEQRPIYEVVWPHRFNMWSKQMTHPDDEYHRVIGRCEQVAIQGYLLHQVVERNELSPGSFFVDVANQKLIVWDTAGRNPNETLTEASVRQEILRVEGEHVQLQALHFRFAANAAQHGAVVLKGRYDQMTDCVVEAVNAAGATFGAEDLVIRRCTFRDNGQLGFSASRAHNLLFAECLVENNNTKGFDRGWEAGGNKLVFTRGAVLEQSRFLRNRGHGIWFDIGNENCTVRQCLIADNEDSGIFYEISFGLQAHDNVILGNGFAVTPGAWGAQAGISLSSSPDCVIERNLIYGNREGFNFREQTRTTPTISNRKTRAVWNHDERIRHNVIARNRDAQVWGWFDVPDGRHWPAEWGGASETPAESGGKPKEDIAGAYVSTDTEAQPTGLTLQQLRLQFEDNLYFAGSGQGWFEWGVTWARHQHYPTLEAFQTGLGVDKGGQTFEPRFEDVLARDFRMSAEQMPKLKSSYPEGTIPGVLLGIAK